MSTLVNGLAGNLPSSLNTVASMKSLISGLSLPVGYSTAPIRGRIVAVYSPAGSVSQRSGVPSTPKGRLRLGVTIDGTDADGREVSSGSSITYDINSRSDNAAAEGFTSLKALQISVASWTDAQIQAMVEHSLDLSRNIADANAATSLHNLVVTMTSNISQL